MLAAGSVGDPALLQQDPLQVWSRRDAVARTCARGVLSTPQLVVNQMVALPQLCCCFSPAILILRLSLQCECRIGGYLHCTAMFQEEFQPGSGGTHL